MKLNTCDYPDCNKEAIFIHIPADYDIPPFRILICEDHCAILYYSYVLWSSRDSFRPECYKVFLKRRPYRLHDFTFEKPKSKRSRKYKAIVEYEKFLDWIKSEE